jgi:hypothetical protein
MKMTSPWLPYTVFTGFDDCIHFWRHLLYPTSPNGHMQHVFKSPSRAAFHDSTACGYVKAAFLQLEDGARKGEGRREAQGAMSATDAALAFVAAVLDDAALVQNQGAQPETEIFP